MINNEIFDNYLIKTKAGSRLNTDEVNLIQKALKEELENDDFSDDLLYYILRFPGNFSLEEFFVYYRAIDQTKRRALVRKFIGSQHFSKKLQNNEANNYLQYSILKCIILIGKIIRGNLLDDSLIFILREICKLILANNKKAVSNKVIETVNKEILSTKSLNLFNIKLSDNGLDQEDFNNLKKVFIKSAFDVNQKERVPEKIQYFILRWLMDSQKKIFLDELERNDIQNAYKAWSNELKALIREDKELINSYRINVIEIDDVICDKQKSIVRQEEIAGKSVSECNLVVETIGENKTPKYIEEKLDRDVLEVGELSGHEGIKSEELNLFNTPAMRSQSINNRSDSEIIKYLDMVKKYVIEKANETKKRDLEKEQNKITISELENEKLILNKRIDKLVAELNDARQNNEEAVKEINELKNSLTKALKEINILNENNEGNLKLIEVYKNEDKSSLNEFKVKLAQKLNLYYRDFNDVKDEVMCVELGEHLRFKLEDVFKELRRYGFEFD